MNDIYNGAICKSYRWSQTHSDLEIRVKTDRAVNYEDVNVVLTSSSIRVEHSRRDDSIERVKSDINSDCGPTEKMPVVDILVEGEFEHSVDIESAFWHLDKEDPSIVIYIDKFEDMWWKQLLINELVTTSGPRNYTISMDRLDDGSRMMIDKLIVEQKNKLGSYDDYLSPA